MKQCEFQSTSKRVKQFVTFIVVRKQVPHCRCANAESFCWQC